MQPRVYIRQNIRKEITIWLDPKTVLETEYGFLTAEQWLKEERARIPQTQIITNKYGQMCLIRNITEGENHG